MLSCLTLHAVVATFNTILVICPVLKVKDSRSEV